LPSRDVLYKTICLDIAKDWPPNQMPSIHRLFKEFDHAGQGVLSEKQVAEKLVTEGYDLAVATRASLAMNMSQNKGTIDFTEFVAACIDLSDKKFEPVLLRKFSAADEDHDGLLSVTDFTHFLPQEHVYAKETAKNFFVNLTGRWSEDGGERVDWPTFANHLRKMAQAGLSGADTKEKPSTTSKELEQEASAAPSWIVPLADVISGLGGKQLVDFFGRKESAPSPAKPLRMPGEAALPAGEEQVLKKLADMGFRDTAACKRVLAKHGSNLMDAAVLDALVRESASDSFQPPSRAPKC